MIINSQSDRLTLFQERKKRFDELKLTLQKKYNLISTFRILFFIVGIIAIVYFANEGNVLVFLFLLFILPVLFGFFINFHNKYKYKFNQAAFLSSINEKEILRLKLDLNAFDPGSEFIDPNHPYTSDLNIFGKHSLFQLINRTVTSNGRIELAKSLKTPLKNVHEIKEKQGAIRETAEKLEWRQDFQARGMHEVQKKNSQKFLISWIREPLGLKNLNLLRTISILFPLAFIFSIVAFFFLGYSGYFILLCAAINGFVLLTNDKVVSPTVEKIDEAAHILRTYASLLDSIEKEDFSNPLLRRLKAKIVTSHGIASLEIKRLSSIVANLEIRKNPYFFMTINLITLWELQWMLKLEKWKRQVKDDIENWLEAVNSFEAIASFSGFSFAYPDMIFPDIQDQKFVIEGQSVNHPLIVEKKRIGNGISLKGLGKTHVVTGSNMSGKSTYMRTIGINSVLALIGAPVPATSFSISPMEVFTCMHIHDSLEEETSSFYAELKRIKQLITKLEEPKPVFYLLDELLKGTNSVDRNLGAQAIIRQLHKKTASGLISTHDLDLGKMETELPGDVKNYSFNSSIINNEIIFDYKLKEGICHSFNASKLMEKMGIEIEK